jgi:hypothetical protein
MIIHVAELSTMKGMPSVSNVMAALPCKAGSAVARAVRQCLAPRFDLTGEGDGEPTH